MTVLRTFLPFVHLLEMGATGPDLPFTARHDAAPRFSKAAVHSKRSIPTLWKSAQRTNGTQAEAA